MAIKKTCDICSATLTVANDATHGCVLVDPVLGRLEIVRRPGPGAGHVCVDCLKASLAGRTERAGVQEIAGYGSVIDSGQAKLRRLN